MALRNDLTGKKFGYLTVIGINKEKSKSNKKYYDCMCVCGNTSITRYDTLTSGKAKSCGCMAKRLSSERNSTHKTSKNKLYSIWHSMMARCYNETNQKYSIYGARGIEVCSEWKDPRNFIKDMESSYKEGLTLDRINVDGNYNKENCRWATKKEQANNRRNTTYVEYNGITKSIADLSRELNIPLETLRYRYKHNKDLLKQRGY